jgi:trans-aconitate 2-methyltransferase
MAASLDTTKDWSANQYLIFNNERTRPVHDLLSQVKLHVSSSNPRIYDLGCGPANSTQVVHSAFPGAKITGVDSSRDMLAKASTALPSADFILGDVSTFEPTEQPDLLFSNAVFHWLRTSTRIPTLLRLFQTLPSGGVLSIQMPDNYDEPSHRAMRDTASMPSKPWSQYFEQSQPGNSNHEQRPDLDPIEPLATYYDDFIPHSSTVNVWRTSYHHVLKDAGAIVEWVKGTGLQPFLNLIGDEEAKKAYLVEYERKLKDSYPTRADGKVLLVYPRFFLVAVKK